MDKECKYFKRNGVGKTPQEYFGEDYKSPEHWLELGSHLRKSKKGRK